MALDGKLAILAAAVILPLAGGTSGQSITWGQPVRVAGNGGGNIQAVSCPSTADCVAMEPAGNTVTWNGTRWSLPDPGIKGASGVVSLSCPTATFCAAAGYKHSGGLWTGHGTTWARDSSSGGSYFWNSVSCTSARFCAAFDLDGYVSTFNGRIWSTPTQVESQPTAGMLVSCSYATRCFALGSNAEQTFLLEWNGTHWTSLPEPVDKYASLACAPTGFCMIADAGQIYVSSSGSTWHKLPAAGPGESNPNLSCTSAKFCMLIGAQAHLYDGSGWRQFSTPPVTTSIGTDFYPSGLACAGQTCAAVAGTPNSSASIFRSGKWGTETSIDNSGELDSVSCLSSGFCATAGMSWDAVIRQPGQQWGKAVQVSGPDGISGVSCTSATFCLLVNRGGYSWRYNGTSWVRAPSLADIGRANDSQAAVSCVSQDFCASAGDGLSVSNGTRWVKPVQAQFPYWSTVSCSSATFCVAMDTTGDYSVFNGTIWSPMKNTSTGVDWWLSADCLSPHFCAASGMAEVATFNGTTWQIDRSLTSTQVQSVTCTSAAFCLAMDRTGHAFTSNGTKWSPAGGLHLRQGAVLESVSCSTPTACVAVDSLGDVTNGS